MHYQCVVRTNSKQFPIGKNMGVGLEEDSPTHTHTLTLWWTLKISQSCRVEERLNINTTFIITFPQFHKTFICYNFIFSTFWSWGGCGWECLLLNPRPHSHPYSFRLEIVSNLFLQHIDNASSYFFTSKQSTESKSS